MGLLEYAACDDLPSFQREIEEKGLDFDEPGLWYCKKLGSNKMGLEQRTPLMVAAMYGSKKVLTFIVSTGKSDVNRACGEERVTALHCAVAGCSVNMVEVINALLDASASANAVDANGNQPLDLFVKVSRFVASPRKKAVELLLRGGGMINEPVEEEEEEEVKIVSKYPADASLPDINEGVYGSDEFRMYSFKVKPCSRAYSHDWTECAFVHPGENARRRDPRKYPYTCVPCPEFRKGSCPKGDSCEYAHGVFESWLHPAQYKTRLCKDETGCARKVCFFAHKREEMRPVNASTGSAVSQSPLEMMPGLYSSGVATRPVSPMSSSVGSSPRQDVSWQNRVNSLSPPALHLNGGSRLKSTLSARDMDGVWSTFKEKSSCAIDLGFSELLQMGGGGGGTDTSTMQRATSSSSSIPKQPLPITPNHHLNPPLLRSPQPFSAGAGNRVGAPPPIPSYSQIPATLQLKHSRSTSQPSSFFSFDSLPPLNPSPVSVDERNAAGFSPSLPPSPFTMCHSSSRILGGGGDGENLPPRKSHRRSNSDVTFGFSSVMSPPLIPSRSLERSVSGGEVASDWSNLVKEEPGEGGGRKKSESEAMDDVFRAYMNLDNIDVLNSFGGNETVDSSGTRKSSSDSEGESSAKVSSGVKRRAGGDIAPTGRHCRSVSMDSGFMGKLDFGGDEKLPVKASPTNSGEGNSSVEFGNSEFTAAEMKKISADEKLAEIVMADPKRVKRILANRVSAARSKERKTQYMAELEHKVQTLQSEATTLSAQLTHLQRDSMGLTNQNNELKFRLQAMEQQAQLRDALSEKLTEEVQRLKMVIGETSSRSSSSSSRRESNISKTTLSLEMFQQLSISQQQMQHSKAQIK